MSANSFSIEKISRNGATTPRFQENSIISKDSICRYDSEKQIGSFFRILCGVASLREIIITIRTAFIMEKVNLSEKFSLFSEQWKPKIVGELNGQMIKLVKFKGPFVWHHHENEDELFYVIKGSFDMEFRDKTVTIREGEFIIVPRGVEHRPNAPQETEVMLFEPATTLNTGNIENDRTVKKLQKL